MSIEEKLLMFRPEGALAVTTRRYPDSFFQSKLMQPVAKSCLYVALQDPLRSGYGYEIKSAALALSQLHGYEIRSEAQKLSDGGWDGCE
eukprot:6202120-Pleurochrysis_carterae.AAC.1